MPCDIEKKRARQRKYAATTKGLATYKRYRESAKGRIRTARYAATPGAKIVKALQNDRPDNRLRQRLCMQEKSCLNLGL